MDRKPDSELAEGRIHFTAADYEYSIANPAYPYGIDGEAHLHHVVIMEKGSVDGRAAIALVFRDPFGHDYLAYISGDNFMALSALIDGFRAKYGDKASPPPNPPQVFEPGKLTLVPGGKKD